MKIAHTLVIATALIGLGFAGSPAMAKKKMAPAAPAAAAAPAAPAAAAPAAAGTKPKSAISIKCSQEADAQKLHGAARKKFREACKKGK